MIVSLVAFVGGLTVIALVLVARYLEVLSWQRSLVAYRLRLPTELNIDAVTAWLTGIAASTHPPALSLLPLPPVAVEIVATTHGISHYVLVTKAAEAKLLAGVRAHLPGARVEAVPDYLSTPAKLRLAAEAIMTSHTRPLATERAEAAATALLASLQPVSIGSEIRYQLIMTSAGTPPRVATPKPSRDRSSVWWEGALPRDAEAVQAARAKAREALLRAVLRVGVAAPSQAQAQALFGRVWPVLHTTNAPSVRIRRRFLPSLVIAERLSKRTYPITRWPMLLNASEAAALVGLPIGDNRLPGLPAGSARQLPPPTSMPVHGQVIGVSNYPGLTSRPLALRTSDRLRHMFVLGPTGSGKSWLLARMILQDIADGYGVIVIDPKGDLVSDVLARIGEHDAERVVVLDASKRESPIGFNVLASQKTEEARELRVDGILHVFKDIWAAFWGPRTDQVMRASLTTLVHSRGADGSVLTLCELLPLLTQPAFRRFIVNQVALPESVRTFWQWYEQLSDGERSQAIGPVLNKVEAFTSRTPIRLMLGQSSGFNFGSVFRERKVALISLAKGNLGSETAALLGALFVSSLWQATLGQVGIPTERRRPVFAYIDEAADIMRLPLDLGDMFAQARGLGLGVVAATQLIAQVPESVRAALLGTVRTQISFAVEHDDASLLAKRFAPLTAGELTSLGPFEIAIRPCLNGVTAAPVTGMTLPLESATRDTDELAAASRQRYGRPRAKVEAALGARIQVNSTTSSRFGREAHGGNQ